MFRTSKLGRFIKLGVGLVTVVPAIAASAVTVAAAPGIVTCDAGYVYVARAPVYSFIPTSKYEYTVRNPGPGWNSEGFSVNSTESYTVGIEASVSSGFNVGANIEIFVVGAQTTVSSTLSASVTKGTGTTLTANLNTPPYDYAHFEAGSWAYKTVGDVDWVTQNCVQSYVATVNSAVIPIKNDIGIDDWYNASAS